MKLKEGPGRHEHEGYIDKQVEKEKKDEKMKKTDVEPENEKHTKDACK